MTEEITRAEVLPCPLHELPGGCDFTVTLPLPDAEYRPTWLESVRRSMFASEHAENWTAQIRQHLRDVHTPEEWLEYLAWEPHRIWTELD